MNESPTPIDPSASLDTPRHERLKAATKPKPRRKMRKPPSYRLKTINGRMVAIVTLPDYGTGKRRDCYLGRANTPESRERYHRLIAEWEANGRRLPTRPGDEGEGVTVNEMILDYWRWASEYYSDKEAEHIRQALKMLRKLYGSTPAGTFGPKALRMVREQMIARGWSRPYINKQTRRIAAAFKWAASYEHIPASVYLALKMLEPLRRGRTTAPEPKPITPVSDEHVAAIEPYVSRQVWAIVRLQRLTGARCGELLRLRPCDIDQSSAVWMVDLDEHKTAHFDKARTLYFNRKAQAVLQPFIADRAADDYLFRPIDAEAERRQQMRAERKTPLYGRDKAGKRPSQANGTGTGPREYYSGDSYRVAIRRACKSAGIPHWHPHQLRHTVATEIRKMAGLEAAQLVLGHSSASITDAVYAERDVNRILSVVELIGTA